MAAWCKWLVSNFVELKVKSFGDLHLQICGCYVMLKMISPKSTPLGLIIEALHQLNEKTASFWTRMVILKFLAKKFNHFLCHHWLLWLYRHLNLLSKINNLCLQHR